MEKTWHGCKSSLSRPVREETKWSVSTQKQLHGWDRRRIFTLPNIRSHRFLTRQKNYCCGAWATIKNTIFETIIHPTFLWEAPEKLKMQKPVRNVLRSANKLRRCFISEINYLQKHEQFSHGRWGNSPDM